MLYWTKSPFNLMCSAIITSLFCSGEDQWTGSYETFSIYLTIAFWANCNLSVMDFPGSQHSCITRKRSCLCFPAGTRGLRSSPLVGWGTAGLSVTISLSAGVKLKVLPASPRRKLKSVLSDSVEVLICNPQWEGSPVPRSLLPEFPNPKTGVPSSPTTQVSHWLGQDRSEESSLSHWTLTSQRNVHH